MFSGTQPIDTRCSLSQARPRLKGNIGKQARGGGGGRRTRYEEWWTMVVYRDAMVEDELRRDFGVDRG